MKKTLLTLMLAIPALAVPPTISNITIHGTTHNATNVMYFVSTGSACQLIYGTSSGVYTYQGSTSNAATTSIFSGIFCEVSLGGLSPDTTYYVLPTARPVSNTTTDNCTSSGCGAIEQIIKTGPLPSPHPEPPTLPSYYLPDHEPDTTGYTFVPMTADGSGNCVAASPVAARTNWTGSITTGESLRSIWTKIWYKTVISFTKGTVCAIPDIGLPGRAGVQGRRFSPDGGPDDWVVWETTPSSAADFPPYGSRTGPQYEANMATILADEPALPDNKHFPSVWFSTYNGQIFECDTCGQNHVWFRNMKWFHKTNPAYFPTGVVDPYAYSNYFRASPYCNYTLTTACNPDPADTRTPSYLVLDRIYSPGAGYPYREMGCYYPGGNYWAIIGTYCTPDFAMPPIYPLRSPVVTGASIYLPYSFFHLNQFDNNQIGMHNATGYGGTVATSIDMNTGPTITFRTQSGLSWHAGDLIDMLAAKSDFSIWRREGAYMQSGTVTSYNNSTGDMQVNITSVSGGFGSFSYWVLGQPATVTFSGANVGTYGGTVNGWLDSTGVTIAYETASGVTPTCVPTTYCHVQAFAPGALGRGDTPLTALFWFGGNFSGGTYFVSAYQTISERGTPSMFIAWRPMSYYFNSGNHGTMENNYLEGMGQTWYNDAQGTTQNLRFRHNYIYFPTSKMQYATNWNGYGYSYRNAIESKELNYGLYEGNVVDGTAAYQNAGSVFYMAGSSASQNVLGVTDITARNNLFRHLSTGFQCNVAGTHPPDPVPNLRYALYNNLWLDFDRDHYNNTTMFGGGFASGPFGTGSCSDVSIHNNTIGLVHGNGPSFLVAGTAAGSTVLGDGLDVQRNLIFQSYDSNITPIITYGGPGDPLYPSYADSAIPPYPMMPASHTATWKEYLDGTFLHTGAGGSFVPDWKMGLNLIIGGQVGSNSGTTWTDLDQTTVNLISGQWPGVTDKFAPGNTMAARMTAAGIDSSINLKSGNPLLYRSQATGINSGIAGANVDEVISGIGLVTNIAVTPGATNISFRYTAPDSRACNVDVSSNGTTWTRFLDSGGARTRTLAASGLTASTAYQYRLLCYYEQTATYEFTADQITSGSATTLANVTRTVLTGLGLLTAPATQALVTFTPASGSAITTTCTTTPCSTPFVPVGPYTRTIQPQTSGAVAVGEPWTATVTIQ